MGSEEPGLQVDKTYLDRFNYLQKTGALDDLALLRNENRVLDTLLNDAAKIYALRSIEEILDFTIDRMLQQFIPARLLILIEPPRGEDLRQYCFENLKPVEDRISNEAYEALAACFTDSPYLTFFGSLHLAEPVREELRRFSPEFVVPMCGIEGVYGVTVIGSKVLGGAYTDVERMYVDKLTRFISIGIQNNLHHQSAITDAKTGLYNHAYFMQRLVQEIAHVFRHKAKAGIVMLDVDHFKNFNDTWGHLAGDEVLNKLALTLKQTVRSEDVASRFGGEEFCILAIECDAKTILEMAERVRLAIEKMSVPYKDQSLSVTASLGCCLFEMDRATKAEEYIDRADKALYLSKKTGRNRSTLYRSGLLGRAAALRKLEG